MGDRTVDNGRMGRLSFVSNRKVTTEIHAAGNRQIYCPLKRTIGLGSSSTTARRPRSTIKNS